MKRIARKQFLKQLGIAGIGFGVARWTGRDGSQLDKKLVREFVGAGHHDLKKVKELLQEYPALLNASHDWKEGDFESCLGAASHVGYKELAQYLIDQGAATNLFTATVFGRIEIVRPMLEAFPNALHAKGPHGLSLLHHAEVGGEEAREVKEYLERLSQRNHL